LVIDAELISHQSVLAQFYIGSTAIHLLRKTTHNSETQEYMQFANLR